MLAAATEIRQLRVKADACYPKRANIFEMFERVELLYYAMRYETLKYISDSFDEDELLEVLQEAERVGNDEICYRGY